MNNKYIEFIKYAISEEGNVPASAKRIDWDDYLDFCRKQGSVGLVFDGIERADLRIPQMTLFEWIGDEQQIVQLNAVTNKCLKETVAFFDKRGLRSCIMKGQANGLMYPKPELRTPGDIDVWVKGHTGNSDSIEIIKVVLDICPDAHYSIHHIKLPIFQEVSVEVHYRPMYLSNWFADRKLQKYISEIEERQFANFVDLDVIGEKATIGVLTDDFNVVYQMLHMYHHFFETRNNFKQFIDYYYLLKKSNLNANDNLNGGVAKRFREFGVMKYAMGIMWVMKEVLGLEDKYLIVEPNEKEGRLILKESDYFGTWSANKLHSVIEQFAANFRVVTHYPKEVLISPLFLIWHQWWKVEMKWLLKR